ncbi:MAG: DUF432 domain-containing protein [Methanolinea sp.]|nr:DUF432 domain-containing protein [Methanolinea sp.]
MFGRYPIPFKVEESGIRISVETSGTFSTYVRQTPTGRAEKKLGFADGDLLVNPVEPVHLPQEVTGMVEFHFLPIAIRPLSEIRVHLLFPVEIGVFSGTEDTYALVDVFSLARPKYSLYGTPERGVITRHIETEVYGDVPPTRPLHEGVFSLTINNTSRDWVWVSRAVFESSSLRIFWGTRVAMSGEMMVFSRQVGETWVNKMPPEDGMTEAVRVYPTRKSLIPEKPSYLMEYGVGD